MSSNYTGHGQEEQFTTALGSISGSSPLRNVETFEAYCAEVQEKLAAHAAHRMSFLQSAFDRLSSLLQAARDVEDTSLSNELAQHRIASRELLDAVRRATHGGVSLPPPISDSVRTTASVYSRPNPTPIPIVPPVSQLSRRAETVSAASQALLQPAGDPGVGPAIGPRLPRRPMRPLIDIETDAASLRLDLKDFVKRFPLNTEQGELNIPNCLRLRSIACRHRRLEEECGDSEVSEVTELSEDIIDLLDGANDQEYTVALDDELDPRPTAYQWGELAERYMEMARAQEGFEWWQRNRNLLAVSDVQPLAEAVAAVQQRFNRLLFRIGARDPFQQQLFDDLRTWAREDQCYLYSLRPKVPMAELMEKAATLEEEYRQRLVDSVITLLAEPDFGEHGAHDEDVLRDSVWECKSHRVPANDRRLREALTPWASFLEGDDRFKDLNREIVIEWERRQEEGCLEPPVEDAQPDPPAPDLAAVREATRGKKFLILGGCPNDALKHRLKTALEADDLAWPNATPSDTLTAFEQEIRDAEIVILVSQYSRREWRNAYDACVREGKKYAQLASVADVTQVVRHLIKQLAPPVAGKKK